MDELIVISHTWRASEWWAVGGGLEAGGFEAGG